MRISFWWRQPSGYFDACTRALAAAGHEVSVLYAAPLAVAPFDALRDVGFDHLESVLFWSGAPSDSDLRAWVINEKPDVLVVTSWGILPYIRAAARAPVETLRLLAVDSPWRASWKQVAGRVTHRALLRRAFDGAWVTGNPQWELVRRLGFRSSEVMEHLYCCDTELFSPNFSPADRFSGPFLFVGRLVDHKAPLELCLAFDRFRQATGSQRRLQVVGNGPLTIQGDCVDVRPFAEPAEIQSLMDRSFALVHPAHLEHWGVVVHEAAAMGLPLILGRSVWAATRFLSPGLNGLYAGPDVAELARALEELDQASPDLYLVMSERSRHLGSLLNLETWVDNFERGVTRLRRSNGACRHTVR